MAIPSSPAKPELEGEFVLKKQEEQSEKAPPSKDQSLGTYELIVRKPNTDPTEVPHKPQAPQVLIKHTLSPFTALAEYPAKLKFLYQEKDETVILLVRQHFITNLPWIFVAVLLLALPPLIIVIFPLLLPFIDISATSYLAIILFSYLLCFGFILVNFSLWYFNVALVTSKRIVDIDITGILFRHVAETKLDLVQDVSFAQYGVIRSFFNYGDVMVQTAGTEVNFEFHKAPNPARIVKMVTELIGKTKP